MSGADGLWQFLYDVNGMRTLRTDYINYITYRYVYNGSQLTQMSKNSDTLYFAYDAAGTPLSFTYGIATYYYVTNLQGDVVAILDSTGMPVVSYTYNAWGKVLSVTGSMAATLGRLNPLTYRGYVYDWETGLYYLQTRYYNPEWCRFINADGYTSTGQGFTGNNMFAYCNNNPMNLLDPTGTVCWALADNNQLLRLNDQFYFQGGGGGVSTRGRNVSLEDFWGSSDPKVVYENLEKYGMAFYNGVPVIELPVLGSNAFSFGVIFVGDEVDRRADAIETLQHEYGHAIHFQQIGAAKYFKYVAIPSVIGYWTDVPTNKYYSQPYEYIADIFGGVNRTYLGEPYPYSISPTAATAYWVFTFIMP